MFKKALVAAAMLACTLGAQAALSAGDIAFNSFNADEDGFSLVALNTIAANTTVFFSDNEWNGSAIGSGGAFNTGESHEQWNSGSAAIAAGSVIRFLATDVATLSASIGTLSRVSVSGSSNYGLGNSNETLYAYLGTSATAPTTFLAAVTNSDFGATDGTLAGTGLVQGSTAIRLNANATSTTPDYGNYSGVRTGLSSFAAYLPLLNNASNWTVDTTNGVYAATVPNTTAFSIQQTASVPEPESLALVFAGLGVVGMLARRRRAI
jgi:hypothetical protein